MSHLLTLYEKSDWGFNEPHLIESSLKSLQNVYIAVKTTEKKDAPTHSRTFHIHSLSLSLSLSLPQPGDLLHLMPVHQQQQVSSLGAAGRGADLPMLFFARAGSRPPPVSPLWWGGGRRRLASSATRDRSGAVGGGEEEEEEEEGRGGGAKPLLTRLHRPSLVGQRSVSAIPSFNFPCNICTRIIA